MPAVHTQPAGTAAPFPARGDEFLGPFPSWTNVKTRYRAAGDGVADDTDAIQRGLDDLGTQGNPPVLFLPAGRYRVTRPLALAFRIHVSIVGEDPATTVLVWDGPAGGTMLLVNGVAYSRFVRLTFDGKRRASIAVDQSYDNSKPHFDTGNEYADNRFVDVEYGIHGGFKDFGFAETSIVRSHFLRNTRAGVALGNFNALDIWIWYSLFEDCAAGVTNSPGAGNYHVYGSIFRNSTIADLVMGNTGGFSARDNYSTGARAFFVGSATNNPALIDLQRNTILDPIEPAAVHMGNQGPALILDNVIRNREGAVGPAVVWSSFFGPDVTSVGNTFTVANAVRSNGRLLALDDKVVSRASLNPVAPALVGEPPALRRRVFEVRPGSDGAAIQRAIDAAAEWIGQRPVVHIPDGTYSVARTLTVLGDLQITGDGATTVLRWTGNGRGPVVRLAGPSKSSLREIRIDPAGQADGLIVDDADQAGARVYLQQVQLRAARQTDLFVNALDQTYVQLEDFGNGSARETTSVKVLGGPLSAAGRPTASRTDIFSGASSGNRVTYEVSAGARLLVRDVWYESGLSGGFANVHGRAIFTAQNLRVANTIGAIPAFNITNLDGTATLLTAHLSDRIAISGDGRNARFLGLGLFCEPPFSACFADSSSPSAQAAVINSRQKTTAIGNRSVSATNIGGGDASAFVRTMLEHARAERPAELTSLPPGVTDVRLFRVWVENGQHNIMLIGRSPS